MISKMKIHKKLWITVGVIIVAILVAIVWICIKNRNAAPTMQMQQSTVTLEKTDLVNSISATGTIESSQSKSVSANLNGVQITEVYVSVGDTVEAGQALVAFDKSDYEQALAEATDNLATVNEETNDNLASANSKLSEAQSKYEEEKNELAKKVKEANAQVTGVQSQIEKLEAQIASATEETVKKEYETQLKSLQESLQKAQEVYEAAVSNQKNTNAQNEASISSAEESVKNATKEQTKNLKEAQKQVTQASETLSECTLTAPISGMVTAVNVEAGDTCNGETMFTIEDTSGYVVTTTVDEYDISKVSVGQKAVILTEATGDDELEGEITFVSPVKASASASSGAQGGSSMSSSSDGYEVTIALSKADDRLRLGLTAKCSIILEEANDVYTVPYDAVHEKEDGSKVIHVADDTKTNDANAYQEVEVEIGMESDYYVVVTGKDLADGMKVIVPTEAVDVSEEDMQQMNGMMPGGGNMMQDTGRGSNQENRKMDGGGMQPPGQ